MVSIKGTSGAEFTTVVETTAGAVGFRSIGSKGFRVRVVPGTGVSLKLDGWRQPGEDGQNRYSKVVDDAEELELAIRLAAKELVVAAVNNLDVEEADEDE